MSLVLFTLLTIATPFLVSTIGTSDPYRLWLNRNTTAPIQVWNRGSLSSVKKQSDQSIQLSGRTRVALIIPSNTEYRLAMIATGNELLDGLRLRMRTTERDYIEQGQNGITLELDRNGLRILDEQSRALVTTDSVQYHPGTPIRIAIEHDGQQTRVAVGCTLFGPFRTTLAATESTIVEPLGSDAASLLLDEIAYDAVRP